MSTANKVKFGLKNVYYAVATINATTGVATYDTPVAIPGAVNLSLAAQSGADPFRADNCDYYTGGTNGGYEGDLELALIPDSFREDVLGEILDGSGTYVEADGVECAPFALLFEFSGDAHKTRHVLYNCTATRPDVASQTTERSGNTPVTETLSISTGTVYSSALAKDIVKARTYADTGSTVYEGWFSSVHLPTAVSTT